MLYLHACLSICVLAEDHSEVTEGIPSPELESDVWLSAYCEHWVSTSGPLHGQEVIYTIKPSLQPLW